MQVIIIHYVYQKHWLYFGWIENEHVHNNMLSEVVRTKKFLNIIIYMKHCQIYN